jgi:hypothetical protein
MAIHVPPAAAARAARATRLAAAAAAATLALAPAPASAGLYENKIVTDIRGPSRAAGCMLFKLEGVTVIDASSAGFFALRRDHPHFAEQYALVAMSMTARRPLSVETYGSSACGLPSAEEIILR